MTNKLKRIFATVLICTLMIGCSSHAAMNAEAKSVNKFTLRVGQKDTLRVTNCKKKTKWKITSGKRVIKIVKRKKNSIVIKARRKGVAKITVKAGKQRWYVKIVVKAKKAAKKTAKKTMVDVRTQIKKSIRVNVSRLKDGKVLFAVYNGSNYFIPSMDVKCALYNDRGTYLEDITIKVSYLGAKKTWYMASTPTSPDIFGPSRGTLESLAPAKTKLVSTDIVLDNTCTNMSGSVKPNIDFSWDGGELYVSYALKNSSMSKTAYCYFAILYKDANGKIVGAEDMGSFTTLSPGETKDGTWEVSKNCYTNKLVGAKSGTIIVYAGHE